MKTISFISPSRNNLSYLKWMYNSIRKNLGYRHEILLADDFSRYKYLEMKDLREKVLFIGTITYVKRLVMIL